MTAALAEDKEDVWFFCFFVFQEKSRDPHQLVTHVKMLGTTWSKNVQKPYLEQHTKTNETKAKVCLAFMFLIKNYI